VMQSFLVLLTVITIACAAPAPGDWSFITCQFTAPNGSVFNFGPISHKTWTWTQSVADLTLGMGDYQLGSATDVVVTPYTFEVALCGPVVTRFPACKNKYSSVNIIDSKGNCVSAGDVRVASMVVVPYSDGVALRYFYGDAIDHTSFQRASVYLICGADKPWYFEHKKTPDDYHFKLVTTLGCWNTSS